MDEQAIKDLIQTELRANLHVLIDRKKKDSFSDARVNTWVSLVSDRISYHLLEKNQNKDE